MASKTKATKTVKRRRGVTLSNPCAVKRLLNRSINETLAGKLDTDVLRAVTYSAQTILKCFELELVEKRIDRIEEAINAQKI